MLKKVVATLALASCGGLVSCEGGSAQPSPDVAEIYVLTPEGQGRSFTSKLASISERLGISSELGQATDDKGLTTYVLDGIGQGVRLRSENVLLSGHEDQKLCGVYTEPHSDPGQYFVSVSLTGSSGTPQQARELLAKIGKALKASGHDVRARPETCSAASLQASSSMSQ